eukprot:TRINITY_DN19553_c0_g1_i2.p1 TRINITY_DN19553_c0_g1~~TRINITY_DN19553_c0_g1_i2.p1  ORF type:complete len:131 (-),score=15.59 TRINITY_DN19553_c0_g1_i2:52-444(-)
MINMRRFLNKDWTNSWRTEFVQKFPEIKTFDLYVPTEPPYTWSPMHWVMENILRKEGKERWNNIWSLLIKQDEAHFLLPLELRNQYFTYVFFSGQRVAGPLEGSWSCHADRTASSLSCNDPTYSRKRQGT